LIQDPPDAYASLPERGGLRLHYLDWGGNGVPMLLLHGLSSSAHIWDLMAPVLAETFHVVALDQRSHGLSDRPDDGFDGASTAADVAEFIRKIGLERPAVVGHSWGANVALQVAHDYPELVRAIVLVDGGFYSRGPEETWEKREKEMRPPDIDGTPVERFVGFLKNFPAAQAVQPEQFEHMVLSNFIIRDGKVYRPLPIPNHMKIGRAIFDQQPAQLLENIGVPVMIIPAVRESSNEMEQRWQQHRERGVAAIQAAHPKVAVHWMQDSVHDVPVQRPRELADVIMEFASAL
jgi:pimeloyl-ACP methyl ester carboxylesterase